MIDLRHEVSLSFAHPTAHEFTEQNQRSILWMTVFHCFFGSLQVPLFLDRCME